MATRSEPSKEEHTTLAAKFKEVHTTLATKFKGRKRSNF